MDRLLTMAILLALPLAAQSRATRPKIERPDGPVWTVIRANCTSCHGIDDYAFYSLDQAGWSKLIADKHKPALSLPDLDRTTLLGWLAERFGPSTKPFPRTYIPPEITTFFSDPEAFRLMNRSCTRCHAIDKVQGARKPADGWRVTLVDMRERGAQLSDQELEQLVEWLGRVWGTNQDKWSPRFAIAALATVLLLADSPGGGSFTAVTANIASAPEPVRIEILRWSTDEERDKLMSAWSLKPAVASGSKAGKGAGKQGKAGKGLGPASGAVATQSPEAALTAALQEAATVGYLWSSEIAGYALRYAGKVENSDGSQRIILITQRKLGKVNQVWRPTVDGGSNSYEFSVIELRLNAKGEGEGKVSLSGKVAEDAAAKIVAIESYNALPIVLREVRKAAGRP